MTTKRQLQREAAQRTVAHGGDPAPIHFLPHGTARALCGHQAPTLTTRMIASVTCQRCKQLLMAVNRSLTTRFGTEYCCNPACPLRTIFRADAPPCSHCYDDAPSSSSRNETSAAYDYLEGN